MVVRAGRIVAVTSPKPMRAPDVPGAVAVIVTVSPSWRKVLGSPLTVTGSAPPQVSSMNAPRCVRPGPEIVPEANRSPVRVDAPFTVMCASIWAGDQYMLRYGGRETTSPFHSTARSMSRPQSSVSRRYGSGSGSWPGSGTRAACRAARGTTHGDTEVANDLPEVRAERHVLPGLQVAGGPVVDEDRAEDMLRERARRHRRAEGRADANHEPELRLDVKPDRRAEHRGRVTWSLALAGGADDAGARDDDRPGPAVVADGQVLPVGRQRLGVRPEEPAEVGRVVLGGVEVHVVGDLERQPQLHLAHGGRSRRPGTSPAVISSVTRDRAADQRAGPSAMNGLSVGAANTSSRSSAARSRTLPATRTPTGCFAPAATNTPYGRLSVEAEQRPRWDLDRAHRASPLIASPLPGGASAEPCHRRQLMSSAPCCRKS